MRQHTPSKFADEPFGNCPGSGRQAAAISARAFNANLLDDKPAAGFDVPISGTVTACNEALPFTFRPNRAAVDLTVSDSAENTPGNPGKQRINRGISAGRHGYV